MVGLPGYVTWIYLARCPVVDCLGIRIGGIRSTVTVWIRADILKQCSYRVWTNRIPEAIIIWDWNNTITDSETTQLRALRQHNYGLWDNTVTDFETTQLWTLKIQLWTLRQQNYGLWNNTITDWDNTITDFETTQLRTETIHLRTETTHLRTETTHLRTLTQHNYGEWNNTITLSDPISYILKLLQCNRMYMQ